MKIFSKKKFIESWGKDKLYSPKVQFSLNTWVKECDGKTEVETSLYEKELQEKKLIRELKMILHDGECRPNWRETIEDTIKLLEE